MADLYEPTGVNGGLHIEKDYDKIVVDRSFYIKIKKKRSKNAKR